MMKWQSGSFCGVAVILGCGMCNATTWQSAHGSVMSGIKMGVGWLNCRCHGTRANGTLMMRGLGAALAYTGCGANSSNAISRAEAHRILKAVAAAPEFRHSATQWNTASTLRPARKNGGGQGRNSSCPTFRRHATKAPANKYIIPKAQKIFSAFIYQTLTQ